MANSIYDVHIEALKIIDAELNRLHITLNRDDGDCDVTQAQISHLLEELTRLSSSLCDAEIKNEGS